MSKPMTKTLSELLANVSDMAKMASGVFDNKEHTSVDKSELLMIEMIESQVIVARKTVERMVSSEEKTDDMLHIAERLETIANNTCR